MDKKQCHSLILLPSSALEKLGAGPKMILDGIVSDALALLQATQRPSVTNHHFDLKSDRGPIEKDIISSDDMMDGITMAGYHIERGARTFAAYAKAMIDDLGDGVKPYLKSWYLAIKLDPISAAFQGMDSAEMIEDFDLNAELISTDNRQIINEESINPDTYTEFKKLIFPAIDEINVEEFEIIKFMNTLSRLVKDNFGDDTVIRMKPYVIQFVRDVQDGFIWLN